MMLSTKPQTTDRDPELLFPPVLYPSLVLELKMCTNTAWPQWLFSETPVIKGVFHQCQAFLDD